MLDQKPPASVPSVNLVPQVSDKINEIVEEILSAEHLEEAFCGYIEQSAYSKKIKRDSCLDFAKKSWTALPAEKHEEGVRHFVQRIHSIGSPTRAQVLFDTLQALVDAGVLPARCVCECLLSCDKLSHHSLAKWTATFQLLQQIISQVDYKGCRDLLRVVLDKAMHVPAIDNVSCLTAIQSVQQVLSHILDRDNCLLPSYFAINEVTKLCSEDRSWPHWEMGEMLSGFVQTFRRTAKMVTVSGRSSLLPVVGHSSPTSNVWKLNPSSLRFHHQGPLPYDKELLEPQIDLLRYVLEQPYSRDMVCNMLSLNKQVKQRCSSLEDQLVDLVVLAMERSETTQQGQQGDPPATDHLLWQHLSSQLIFFVLFQFASFPHMVGTLYEKLKGRNLRKGRDHLMWVLLQFISGSIQKNPLGDFLPVMRLYDLLYGEGEALPVPEVKQANATHAMAVTCIWIHLNKKAQNDGVKLQRPIPSALYAHINFLKQRLQSNQIPSVDQDYCIALLCNAYSTNTDCFTIPMGILVDSIHGNTQLTTLLPGSIQAAAPTKPLPMNLLDSLTVHAKMSLIHSIVTRVIRQAQAKSTIALAPALVETYSRLLVYMEIESLGIKGFISQLLPNVFKSNAWGILHTLLEMFSYRLHHIQPHYRVQLLSHLHSLSTVPQTNDNQLHLCVESTALRLIMGLGSAEVQPQLSRVYSEPKTVFLSSESEELNRALVLTLARAMHATGSETISSSWCREVLTNIMQMTPHSWSSHTLECFPAALAEFFNQNPVPSEDKAALKKNVDNEYRKWKSMASENDLVAHFSMQGTPPLFLCVLWRSLLEDSRISPTAYKVLERLGPRALSAHLRTFADYLVHEFSASQSSQFINKYVEALNDLIWKCNVVPIDRLVLVLALRSFEASEAQVCFFIIRQVLLKHHDLRNRVTDFVRDNSPEHWQQSNWHEKHMAFHMKYPEKFYWEGVAELGATQHQYLPIYFGNVCLRLLPVLDILIHRCLELLPAASQLDTVLDHLGPLYKFHDRPMTYLYNTLHYYEKKLRDKAPMKKKLIQTIIGSVELRVSEWCVSKEYDNYLDKGPTDWIPMQSYYFRLVERLVNTIAGKSQFPHCDWRFNEFPNPAAHALHATCIELMALPVSPDTVSTALLNLVLQGATQIPREKMMAWMNAIGLIFTALPESYWSVVQEMILEVVTATAGTPLQLEGLHFTSSQHVVGETRTTYVLALCHALWQHASIGQLSVIPQFIRDRLKPVIRTEEQLLLLCHLVGPFLQRFHAERTRCLLELTVELYEILEGVDRHTQKLNFMDTISDFFYHIKYMFVGDGVKSEVEKVIRNLRPLLQRRLRFISHHGKDDQTPT